MNSKEACDFLTKEFHNNNLPIIFSTNSNLPSGVFENQIKTFVNLMISIIDKPTNNKIVLGMMQSGKTGTAMLNFFIAPILKLLNNDNYVLIHLLTNRLGHKAQTEKEMEVFLNAFKDVTIEYNNNSYSINQHNQFIQNNFDNFQNVFARTNNKKNINNLHKIAKQAKIKNFNVIFNVDEIHWGIEHNGVFEQYLEENIENLSSNSKDIFIGSSATPYQFTNLQNVDVIHQFLGNNYQGPNFFAGKIHDNQANTKLQNLISLNDVNLQQVIPSAFHYVDQFFNFHAFNTIDIANDIQSYRIETTKIVQNFIENQFKNQKNTGMVIRWTNDNKNTQDFINQLNLENITIIPYFNQLAKIDIKECILEETMGSNQNFVIFVTGAARMADAFPTNVKYFVDFTYESSTLASLLQGLYGRSCGYNKNSTVFLSQNNYEIINDYINSLGKYVIHPHESVVVEKQKRGRKPMSITIDKETTNKTVLNVFTAIQEQIVNRWLDHNANTLKSASKRKILNTPNKQRKTNLFDILTNEVLNEFENEIHNKNPNIKIKLLRPNQIDCNNGKYNINEEGAEIGFRNSSGGNRKSINSLYPQIFVEKINGIWTIQAIQLRFVTSLKSQPGFFALPSMKEENDKIVGGLATQFMNENEKQKAKTMKGYSKKFFKEEMERFN